MSLAPMVIEARQAVQRTASRRSTREWQALDAAHHLHPFSDAAALNAQGARVISHAEGVYLWDSDGVPVLAPLSPMLDAPTPPWSRHTCTTAPCACTSPETVTASDPDAVAVADHTYTSH